MGIVREELALFPSYEVEGVAQPDKISAELASQCREVFNIPIGVEITTESLHGKSVIVVHVPEAQPQDKPIFFRRLGLPKGAMRLIGSTDQSCADDDMAVLYQGRHIGSFEASLVPDASLGTLHLTLLPTTESHEQK